MIMRFWKSLRNINQENNLLVKGVYHDDQEINWFMYLVRVYILPLLVLFASVIILSIFIGVFFSQYFVQADPLDFNPEQTGTFVEYTLTLLSTVLIIFYFFWRVKYLEKREIKTLGFRTKEKGTSLKKYGIGLLYGLGLQTIIVVCLLMFGSISLSFNGFNLSTLGLIFVAFLAFVIQGAGEEIMIRGHMLPILSKRHGIVFAFFFSSLIFGLLHTQVFTLNLPLSVKVISMINLILAGIVFALMALEQEDLWAAMGFHTAWNFVMAHLYGAEVSGIAIPTNSQLFVSNANEHLLSGGSFGYEGGIVGLVVLIGFTIYYACRLTSKYSESSESSE